MRRTHSGSDCTNQLPRTLGFHRTFCTKNVLERSSLNKLHYEEWHSAANHAEVSHGNDVLMSDGGGGKCFLTKAGSQHRIVTNKIRKNDLYRVSCFEEDVTRLKDDPHATLAQTSLQQVT